MLTHPSPRAPRRSDLRGSAPRVVTSNLVHQLSHSCNRVTLITRRVLLHISDTPSVMIVGTSSRTVIDAPLLDSHHNLLYIPLSAHTFFFLNNPAPPEFSPFPLHDALPI